MKTSIFISYCWTDKDIATKYYNDLIKLGFDVTIDHKNLENKENVKDFMNRIKKHDYVITVISESYLKSYNCLYEVGSLMEDKEYKKKTLQIVLPNAKIFRKEERYECLKYWDNKIKNLDDKIKENISVENIELIVSDLKESKEIREILPKFIIFLITEKAFTEVEKDNYKEILDYIESQKNIKNCNKKYK
jgi:hypothetical protein